MGHPVGKVYRVYKCFLVPLYLSLVFKHFDTNWHSRTICFRGGGGRRCYAPFGSANLKAITITCDFYLYVGPRFDFKITQNIKCPVPFIRFWPNLD